MTAGTPTVPLVAGTKPLSRSEGAELARRVERRVVLAEVVAGGAAAFDVWALLWWILPSPGHSGSDSDVLLLNGVAMVVYMTLGLAAGTLWARRRSKPVFEWLAAGREPTERERDLALRMPLQCASIDATGWGGAALLFFAINAPFGIEHACHIGSVIFMGGLTCTALVYLLVERHFRPVTERALAAGPAPRPVGPGVTGRLLLAWLLATGVPLAGLLMLGGHALLVGDATNEEVGRSVVALALVAILSGLAATVLVARSVADPLKAVRRALGRIESGDLGAHVRVDDSSEVGLLQTGFNRMAAGLRERERVADLFGRHVGSDVARAAIDGDDPALGGEVRDVAVVFIDLIGSTRLAATRSPREVVQLLNDVFAVVVDVVGRHGGWVNKFEGDAALCVFGAPADHPDPAGAACEAARTLRERLARLPDVDAGIGLSWGPAVAGYVGAEHRFEYTVIGDPVNEAARLCELAKRRPERVLASEAMLARCLNGEAGRWAPGDEVVLRGRTQPTRLASPAAA